MLDVDGEAGWGILNIGNFRGRHMRIIPYLKQNVLPTAYPRRQNKTEPYI